MSETKTEKQFANPANDYIVVRKSELADAYSRVEELERILRKIVKSDFPHAVWCNYQHPSCKSCNCGMADARQALFGESELVEPKEVSVEELARAICGTYYKWPSFAEPSRVIAAHLHTKYTIKEKV